MTANGIRHKPAANAGGNEGRGGGTARAHAHTAWPSAAPLSQCRIKYDTAARKSSAELAQRPTTRNTPQRRQQSVVAGGKCSARPSGKLCPTRKLQPRLSAVLLAVVVIIVPIRSVRCGEGDTQHSPLKMTHKHARARGANASRFRSESAQRASRAARTLLASMLACLYPGACASDGRWGGMCVPEAAGRPWLQWSRRTGLAGPA